MSHLLLRVLRVIRLLIDLFLCTQEILSCHNLVNFFLKLNEQVLEPVMSQCFLGLKPLSRVYHEALLYKIDHQLLLSAQHGVDLSRLKLGCLRVVEFAREHNLVERHLILARNGGQARLLRSNQLIAILDVEEPVLLRSLVHHMLGSVSAHQGVEL